MRTYKENTSAASRRARQSTSRRGAVARSADVAFQITQIKNGLVREFGSAIGGHHLLLRSALNEAEALAWQTDYPHLLFPVLAHEKAFAVNRWAARQRRIERASRELSMAE